MRFAYVEGRDVLHGVDLDVGVGERIAMVGPSGAGKSTLGRLLAGIHPPRTGAVTVGGVGLVELPLDDLRGHVALVTQEHHVFVGTLRENLALAAPPGATDDDIRAALDAVDALDWVDALPDGLDTVVGSGGRALTAAQAQQVALARLVLADPHTLVLDEATSLIDPRAARHLERSLAAVLEGRTVIAIAHRLFSAHDADRVAVVEDGVISEFGSHDELVAAGGSVRRALGQLERQRPLRTDAVDYNVTVTASRPVSGARPEIRTPEWVLYFLLIEISTAVSGSSWRASRSRPASMPSRPVTQRASSMTTCLASACPRRPARPRRSR